MTSVTSVPFMNLGLPEPVDKMEISSPYNRNLDDFDIDIDIPSKPLNQDEDFILEDSRSDAITDYQTGQEGHTDDVMVDEESQSVLSEDKMMRDDDIVQDEHLTDASDISLEENIADDTKHNEILPTDASGAANEIESAAVDDTADAAKDTSLEAPSTELQNVNEGLNQVAGTEESGENQQADRFIEHSAGQPSEADLVASKAVLSGEGYSIDKEEGPANNSSSADEGQPHTGEYIASEGHGNQDQTIFEGNVQEEPEAAETDVGNDNILTNHEADVASEIAEQDLSGSFTTPLHPIKVHYDGNDISLFPPSEDGSSETYLLADENLVNVSITDLLRACRVVLGETVDEVDELVLSIKALGISLSEECLYSASTSFNDILNVYTNLKQVDGLEAEPLYVTLSSRSRFSVRFQALQAAISEGKGLSQIPFLTEAIEARIEQEEENSVHDEDYGEQNEPQAEFEGKLSSDGLLNLPAHDSEVDERASLNADETADLDNDEKTFSQTLRAEEDDVGDLDPEEGQKKESPANGTTYKEPLDLKQVEDDDDLVIYGDDDEDIKDLPAPESDASELHVKHVEQIDIYDNVSSTAERVPAEFLVEHETNEEISEHETNVDVTKSESEWGDEEHDDTAFEANDDGDDHEFQDNLSYNVVEDSENVSKLDKPSNDSIEIESSFTEADEIGNEKIPPSQFVTQEENNQGLYVDANSVTSEARVSKSSINEDAPVLKPSDDLYDESANRPEDLESSTLQENDSRLLLASHIDEADEEETENNLTAGIGQIIDPKNSDYVDFHQAGEQIAISITESPSAKRQRSDDPEDSSEGEETPTDTKRIRSL